MRDMLQGKRWSATSRLHHLGAVAMSVLLALVLCGPAFGQQGGQQVDVSGKVTAPDGEKIRGASVRIRGTTTSAVTDDEGKYSLTAPSDAVLVLDRKSTRLNSSHLVISYAVFCLKKKKKRSNTHSTTN